MDVTIPAHNLRTLSSALSTLSKIGKYLYIEFDPLAGVTFRTLNDGKSSFAQFQFDVGFFERCVSPPETNLKRRVRSKENGRDTGTSTSGGRRKRGRSQTQTQTQDNDIDEEKYLCRVLIRTISSIMGARKGLQSLRIRSLGSTSATSQNESDENESDGDNSSAGTDTDASEKIELRMQLSFEFRIQSEDGIMRITHKVGVSETESVVAEASRSGCSEIVAAPRVLLKMIDPVKSSEIALIVNDEEKKVTATSFHYADANITKNLVLSASAAAVLKTETSIGCDEFDEFVFSDDFDDEDAPEGAEKEVALVFSTKEARAMIQFCAQENSDDELRTIVSFHYGGRPIVIETEGDSYKGEVMLSTIAHRLLNGVDLTSRQQKSNRSRNSTSNLRRSERS